MIDSIARNHAFVDGNKRTGLMTAILTYELNGVALNMDADKDDDFEKLALWVVKDKPEIPEIAEKFKVLTKRYQVGKISQFARNIRKSLTLYDSENL